MAEEYLTIWFDDFLDEPGDPEEERSDEPWLNFIVEYSENDEHDGFYYISRSSYLETNDCHGWVGYPFVYIYGGLAVRLRCNNSNKLAKTWGFGWPYEWHRGYNSLVFVYYPPEADTLYQGFWAEAHVNGEYTLRKKLTGIDVTEWHNYTILWEPNAATFLVDGEVVAITDKPPRTNTQIIITDMFGRLPVPPCDVQLVPTETTRFEVSEDADYTMQIDYVRAFTTEETLRKTFSVADAKVGMHRLLPHKRQSSVNISESKALDAWRNQDYNNTLIHIWEVILTYEILELTYLVEDALRVMEDLNRNITKAKDVYDKHMADWINATHLDTDWPFDLCWLTDWREQSLRIIAWRDVIYNDLFAHASQVIETALKRGEDTQLHECHYSTAHDLWEGIEYSPGPAPPFWGARTVKGHLERILAIPQPALLSLSTILGLILLPALLRRGHG
jgi:hypothetical protein